MRMTHLMAAGSDMGDPRDCTAGPIGCTAERPGRIALRHFQSMHRQRYQLLEDGSRRR